MNLLIQSLDILTEYTGRLLAWFIAAAVLGTVGIVVLRYAVGVNTILLQDLVMYLHGFAFMLAIPYALKHDAHVRVDLLYSRLGVRGRQIVNLVGHLVLLFPTGIAMILYSQGYVANAWRIREGSQEVGGIHGVYLLKTLIPAMAVLLMLQGLAETLRILRSLGGRDA
jgi:TRAP-type mannitol/chloroaromatic compound transport system permease small subunit